MMKIFIVLLIIGVISAGQKIPWWHIKAAQKQGPNVCTVEQIPGTNRKFFTECKYWKPRSICGKETMIKYECCEGYQMVPGQLGCTGVKPLLDVVETARSVGAAKFAQFLEKTGVAGELGRGPAVTLFAPSDEAFDNYLRIHGGIKAEKIRNKGYRELAMYHFVDKRIPSKQWGADLLIDSKLPSYKIRLNKYSNGMETVNCEAVIRKNQHATNGVVHIINSVLIPERYEDVSIFEAMDADGRFNILAKALRNSDIIKRLDARKTSLTFFAPSDEAFQKIPAIRLNKLLGDKDTLEALVANHIIEHPICLPGVISKHHSQTLGQRKFTLDCGSRGATIENLILRKDFLHGLNGLVYLIDNVLLPDRAKTVTELANDEKLNAFMRLINKAGLEETLDNLEAYTLFVPSEAAMHSMPKQELEYMTRDLDNVKEFVLNHAVLGKHTSDTIYDNQAVMTLNETTSLRFQVYRGIIGIEDATIEKADRVGRNGVLHIIDKVLRPNANSLDDVLRMNGNFSIWLAAMDKMREIEPQGFKEFRQSPESVAYTYFVPSNEAFEELGEAELNRLMTNSTYLSETLKNHVADDMMASGGFKRDLQYFVKTKQNMVDVVKRNDVMKVNHATLTKCDMLNRNGVAHEINKVLLPVEDKRRRFVEKKRRVRWTKTSGTAYSRHNRFENI